MSSDAGSSSPGDVAGCTGRMGKARPADRRMKLAEMALRWLVFGLGILVIALLATATQSKVFFSLEKKAKFTDMKALVFVVVANGIAAGYSLIQGLRCALDVSRGGVLCQKPLAWAIFACDQMMAYLLLAAVAAAGSSGALAEFGQPELQWMKVCNLYGAFCRKVGEGIMSAIVVSLAMVSVSWISAFNLFRLYGRSKKVCNGSF